MERDAATSFGALADLYDRRRPGYPAPLFDALLEAVPDAGRVLEAGAGTGKATVALARRGLRVDAVEPDPAMAAVARRRASALPVVVHVARFEDWEGPAGAFDLVTCAQAWHWIDDASGAAVAARALAPAGVLALWWTRPDRVDGPVFDAVRAAYRAEAPELLATTSLLAPADDERPPLPGFGPWSRSRFAWTQIWDAVGYGELVETQPDHRALPAERRARLVRAVRAAIRTAGAGRFACPLRADLLLARPQRGRRGPAAVKAR